MLIRIVALTFVVLSTLSAHAYFANDDLAFASPYEVGMSAERLGNIDNVIQRAIDDGEIPHGAALVARHGKIVYQGYFGHSDLESGASLREDTIFRIASMTKAVTSVAAMMLYEEGHFLMNDPLYKYIPAFRDSQVAVLSEDGDSFTTRDPVRPITIRDVLNHQAGMIYQPFFAGPLSDLYLQEGVAEIFPFRRNESLESYINRYATVPMFGDPGGEVTYGVATDVLGRLVEVWSGMLLQDFFRERIFEPLGMEDTSFFLPDNSPKVERLATMYTSIDGVSLEKRQTAEVHSEVAGPRMLGCGAAGLLSTPTDYFRFAQMLLNKGVFNGHRILSHKSVAMMTSNQLGETRLPDFLRILGDQTGFGMAIRNERGVWDGLESPGTLSFAGIYWTRFWIDPQEDLIIISMTQAYTLDQSGFAHKVKNVVYQAISRPDEMVWPKFKK